MPLLPPTEDSLFHESASQGPCREPRFAPLRSEVVYAFQTNVHVVRILWNSGGPWGPLGTHSIEVDDPHGHRNPIRVESSIEIFALSDALRAASEIIAARLRGERINRSRIVRHIGGRVLPTSSSPSSSSSPTASHSSVPSPVNGVATG